MNRTTEAMVLTEFNQPLQRQEFPLPELREGELLVQMAAAGVCGSDVHMWRGEDPRTPLPIILGHEGVGWVAGLRRRRKTIHGQKIKEGDLILWHRGVSCGHCYYCVIAREPSLCSHRLVYGINWSSSQPPHLRGCYARHILLDPQTDLYLLPPSGDPAVLVPASCSGSTVAHAFDLTPPRPGETVLVQGPGPLGLFAVAFARSGGAGEIAVIGGTPARLELCRDFGATLLLDRNNLSREERRERIMELTHGRGVDYAIEATGNPEAVAEGISLVRPGGRYLVVGFGEPRGIIPLDLFHDLARRNLHLQGVWVSDARHTEMALQLVLQQRELFARMITHRFPLEQAGKALEAMEKREAMKAVLIMEGA